MRPISLEIEGFTSFRQKTIIDFSGFDLFAITGPTGAGKTSIIDAMTYALYGCTPRISNKSIKELISQGSDRLRVLLEFSSGESFYRIARETKWTGKSSITSIRLEEKEGEEWIHCADKVGDADALIGNIVGLDFNGFTKSVVLPQGRFDEFLKGKIDERRDILSNLLQLDVYVRMMQRANEIAKENKNKAETLKGLLIRDYVNSTTEDLTRLREELERLKPSLEPLTQELNRVRESIPVAHQFRQGGLELTAANAELKNLGPSRTLAEKNHAHAEIVIQTSQRKIEVIDVRIRASSYDSEVRDNLAQKLHKSEQLLEQEERIQELEDSQKKKLKRQAELEEDYEKAEVARQLANKKRISLQKQYDADKENSETALRKYGSADTIKAIIETNKRQLKDQLKKAKVERELLRLTEDQKVRAERLDEIDEELTRAVDVLERSKADLELLKARHSAEEIKLILKEGESCPVCEQTVKRIPKSKAHPSVELAKKSVGKNEQEVNRLVTSRSTMKGELTQLIPQADGKRDEIKEIEITINEAAGQIRAVTKKSPGPDTHAELEMLREKVVVLEKKVAKSSQEINEAREIELSTKENVDKIGRQLIEIQAEVSDVSELKRLRTQSKTLRTTLGKYADMSVVKAELKKQNDAKIELEKNGQLKEAESGVLSKAKDALTESSRILEGLKVKEEQLEFLRVKLSTSIQQHRNTLVSGFPDLKIDAVGPDRDAATQLERRSEILQSRREAVQKEILQSEGEIKTLGVQIKRAAEMRKEINRHTAESAIAHELALSLRGDQFIAFIQQEAYHRLALDGSAHLKLLSSDRYSFGFDKDEFVVLDHWNADEPRPVTTLSGGESFLASLALALALAEGLSGLSHGRGRFALESLFLDEGFGTLDAETLDVVLQGVENLSTTDRLVGIVSHIPELAERLPSRIQVLKAQGGSTIEVS